LKTVIITGSAQGFGYEMLKVFRENDFNCVMCDINENKINESIKELEKTNSKGEIFSYYLDVTKPESIQELIDKVINKFNKIDIWINNAGVNQETKLFYDLELNDISKLIDIDLKGVMYSSNLITKVMLKQNEGSIYNVEGLGSDDAKMEKFALYGTSKRAVTYFTEAMQKELKSTNIIVGKITPGIMKTNFVNHSINDNEFKLDEKTKNIYNILGDYPETIARNIVPKIINNKKKNPQFIWLTKRLAFKRFLTSVFKKRDIF